MQKSVYSDASGLRTAVKRRQRLHWGGMTLVTLVAVRSMVADYQPLDIDGDGITDAGVSGLSNDYPAVRIWPSSGGVVDLRAPYHDVAFFGQTFHGDGEFAVVRGYVRIAGCSIYATIDVVYDLATRLPIRTLRVVDTSLEYFPQVSGVGGGSAWAIGGQPADLPTLAFATGAGISKSACVEVGGGWLCSYEVIEPCGIDCGIPDPGAGNPPSTIDPPDGGNIYPPLTDCNRNGVPDQDELAGGSGADCDGDGLLDDCEPDCDDDGLPDDCELDLNNDNVPDDCEVGQSDCSRVDIDIDAAFDGLPDNDQEDAAETNVPGRIMFVNGCSTDGDDKPDFADGFGASHVGTPSSDSQSEDYELVSPGSLTSASITFAPNIRRFRIDVVGFTGQSLGAAPLAGELLIAGDASAPAADQDWRWHEPASGIIRLWRRWNATELRSAEPAPVGHAVALGTWHNWSVWGPVANGLTLQLLIEGIRMSAPGGALLKVTAEYPKRDGPGVEVCEDSVRCTVARVATYDLRHWGPASAPGEPGIDLVEKDLQAARGSEHEVIGALADGASLCLFRVEPDLTQIPAARQLLTGLKLRVRAARTLAGSSYTNWVGLVGSLHEPFGPTGDGPLVLPPVPIESMTAEGLQREMTPAAAVSLGSGAAIYRTAGEFIDGSVCWGELGLYEGHWREPSPGFPLSGGQGHETSGDRPHFVLSVEVIQGVGNSARTLGGTEFHLLRPPVVLVHGINAGPSTWSQQLWNEQPAFAGGYLRGFATRVRLVDYEATCFQGFPENYHHLSRTIEKTLGAYRDPEVQQDFTSIVLPTSPANDLLGKRFAATRVDAVGHSQGGQLIRWYAAEFRHQTGPNSHEICAVGTQMTRRDGYEPLTLGKHPPNVPADPTAESGYGLAYLRPDNWMAGGIRRAIAIGSPFHGSILANLVQDRVSNVSSGFAGQHLFLAESWVTLVNSEVTPEFVKTKLRKALFPEASPSDPEVTVVQYRAPTCAADLAEPRAEPACWAWTQRLLFGQDFDLVPIGGAPTLPVPDRHYFCRFPSGRRAVAISLLGGTMSSSSIAVTFGLHSTWFDIAAGMVEVTDPGENIPLIKLPDDSLWSASAIMQFLENSSTTLGEWLDESDSIVHEGSQSYGVVPYAQYADRLPQSEVGDVSGLFRKSDPLMHFEPFAFYLGETTSPAICDWVHRMLYSQIGSSFRSSPGGTHTPSRFCPLWPFETPANMNGGQYAPPPSAP